MTGFLKQVLSPPVFEDEEKNHRAYLLHVIVWGLVLVPIPYVLYISQAVPEDTTRALIQAGFGETVNFLLLYLLQKGHVNLACILQVSMFWLFFTASAATNAGTQGATYMLGYPLVIIIAGILLGGRAAIIVTAASLSAGGVMIYGENHGWFLKGHLDSPFTVWVLSLLVFPMSAVLQELSARAVNRALRRARASEERYKIISRVSTDYLFEARIDENGENNLVWVAGAFKEMTGFTFEEYVKTGGWATKIHPDDMEQDEKDMQMLMENKEVKTQVRVFSKNGEVRWERISAHPLWDEKNNRLAGIIGSVQDVTAQKIIEAELKYERDLLQFFIDNIPDSVYFKDTDSHFIRINRAQAKFLGIDNPTQALGKTDFDFQDPVLAKQFFDEEQRIIQSGEPVRDRIEFNPTPQGQPRWITATKVPARDASGAIVGIIGISRDITEQRIAEEKLHNTMLQQSAILNNIPDMAWLKDRESRYIAVNDQFMKVAGRTADQIIGKTDFEIWNDDFAHLYRADDIFVMESKQRRHIEEKQRDYTGKEYWVETVKTPFYNAAGEVIGTTGLARDITERKTLQLIEQQRRETLEKVMELGKTVAVASDLKTTIQKIWHGVHEDLEFDRLAIFLYNPVRNSMDDTVGTDNQGNMVENWNLWFPIGEDTPFSHILQQPENYYFTRDYAVENNIQEGHEMSGVKDFIAVAAWVGDKPVAVICADNLISQRNISNDQLEALRLFAGYAGLAIENARLTETIQNELNQRQTFINDLEAKNAELERFTYTVSHDLKSPLVTIRGFLGYIEQDARKGNYEQLQADLTRIELAADKMQKLLKDLLELSRVGRLVNPSEKIPFHDLVHDAVELVRGQLNARQTEIQLSDHGEVIFGDRTRLIEVLQNLLDNAIKFTANEARPKLEIGSTDHPQHGKIFYVKDNGIGIEKQYHERIFGLFNKLDSTSQGTGVGLALVKRIIEVHGGVIWVESEPGHGTAFYFSLPLSS